MYGKLEKLYDILEESVIDVFDNNLDRVSKWKILKHIQKLYSEKSKLSKKIMKTKCPKKMVILKNDLGSIEDKIASNKESWRKVNEDNVINEIKSSECLLYCQFEIRN